MVGKHGRCFRKHHFHIRIGQRFAFQVTEILRLADDPFAGAETFFAAQIQGKLGAELAAVVLQEANQAAEMIIMAVAENQRIDAFGADPEHVKVVVECFGCESKVEKMLRVSLPRPDSR
jgi:hypothetical protein